MIASGAIFTIAVTYGLDLFTRLLLSPTLSSTNAQLPTLSTSTLSYSAPTLTYDDTFESALIKICVACVNVTSFVGLANELAPVANGTAITADPVNTKEREPSVMLTASGAVVHPGQGELRRRMTRPRSTTPDSTPALTPLRGLGVEVKQITVHQPDKAGFLPKIGGHLANVAFRNEIRYLVTSLGSFWRGFWAWFRGGQRRSGGPDQDLDMTGLGAQSAGAMPEESGRMDEDASNNIPSQQQTFPKVPLSNSSSPPAPINEITCVMCLSNPRVVLCWPCRCLSLCDECRTSLAANSGTGKTTHKCPCCQQK